MPLAPSSLLTPSVINQLTALELDFTLLFPLSSLLNSPFSTSLRSSRLFHGSMDTIRGSRFSFLLSFFFAHTKGKATYSLVRMTRSGFDNNREREKKGIKLRGKWSNDGLSRFCKGLVWEIDFCHFLFKRKNCHCGVWLTLKGYVPSVGWCYFKAAFTLTEISRNW